MAGLTKEEIIMSSNDNSITLTTHRVLQKTSEINKEILLKDIVSQEVVRKRHKYYKILSLLFGIPSVILFFLYLTKSGPFERTINTILKQAYKDGFLTTELDGTNENGANTILVVLFVLTLISLCLLFTTSERHLKIAGRFNEIEFSQKDLSDSSLNKFINRLTVESDNRKRED